MWQYTERNIYFGGWLQDISIKYFDRVHKTNKTAYILWPSNTTTKNTMKCGKNCKHKIIHVGYWLMRKNKSYFKVGYTWIIMIILIKWNIMQPFKNMLINILLWGGVSSRTVDLCPAKLIKIIIKYKVYESSPKGIWQK